MQKLLLLSVIWILPLIPIEQDTTKTVKKTINLKEQLNKQSVLNSKLDSLIIKNDTVNRPVNIQAKTLVNSDFCILHTRKHIK